MVHSIPKSDSLFNYCMYLNFSYLKLTYTSWLLSEGRGEEGTNFARCSKLSTLDKLFSRRHFETFYFLFFPRKQAFYISCKLSPFFQGKKGFNIFLQMIYNGDHLQKMSKPVFWEKKKHISNCRLQKRLPRMLCVKAINGKLKINCITHLGYQINSNCSTKYEPGNRISYKITCAPIENSDQTAHPRSLIRVFHGH